ncbi:DUF669 domain-containing protein [Ligilactobacillus faecis]|uniref:DUF669 domain-containing protein n=1 Tax=Ligilactobacillus faecis TaxID=762833 RepID=UPI00246974FA|nr:DUF669 domain-containing protein [Ligilactobacillus faecis]WGN89804.1 DUF669 domain-containing protein [Ligilactobacillus faecis]
MAFKGLTVDENNVLGRRVEEAGTYNVRLLPTSELKTSSTGKEMLVLNYEVLDGKYAGGTIKFDNVVYDDTTPEKEEQSLKRFNTLLVVAGVPAGTQINTLAILLQGLKKYNKMNVTVEWNSEPNDKGYYNLNVTSHNPTDPEGSKPNGVFAPARQQPGASNFGNRQPAIDQAANNLPDNFGPSVDPFAGAGTTVSDADLPF